MPLSFACIAVPSARVCRLPILVSGVALVLSCFVPITDLRARIVEVGYDLETEVTSVVIGDPVSAEGGFYSMSCRRDDDVVGNNEGWYAVFRFDTVSGKVVYADVDFEAEGEFDLSTGAFTIDYDSGVRPVRSDDGEFGSFFSRNINVIAGVVDVVDFETISGTNVDSSITSWVLDDRTVECSATWAFTGVASNEVKLEGLTIGRRSVFEQDGMRAPVHKGYQMYGYADTLFSYAAEPDVEFLFALGKDLDPLLDPGNLNKGSWDMTYSDGAWRFEEQAPYMPIGRYSYGPYQIWRDDVQLFQVPFPADPPEHPDVPRLVSSTGEWSDGVLVVTQEQAAEGFVVQAVRDSVVGTLAIDLVGAGADETLAMQPSGESIFARVPGGMMRAGEEYSLELRSEVFVKWLNIGTVFWPETQLKRRQIYDTVNRIRVRVIDSLVDASIGLRREQFEIDFGTIRDRTYEIWSSADPTSGRWEGPLETREGTGSVERATFSVSGEKAFYQVRSHRADSYAPNEARFLERYSQLFDYKFTSETRYEVLYEGSLGKGNWTYEHSGNVARLVMTFDQDGNDASVAFDELQLHFISEESGIWILRFSDEGQWLEEDTAWGNFQLGVPVSLFDGGDPSDLAFETIAGTQMSVTIATSTADHVTPGDIDRFNFGRDGGFDDAPLSSYSYTKLSKTTARIEYTVIEDEERFSGTISLVFTEVGGGTFELVEGDLRETGTFRFP